MHERFGLLPLAVLSLQRWALAPNFMFCRSQYRSLPRANAPQSHAYSRPGSFFTVVQRCVQRSLRGPAFGDFCTRSERTWRSWASGRRLV